MKNSLHSPDLIQEYHLPFSALGPVKRHTIKSPTNLSSQGKLKVFKKSTSIEKKVLSLSVELVEKCCWMPEELDLQSYDLCSPQKGAQSHKLPGGRRIFSILDGKG